MRRQPVKHSILPSLCCLGLCSRSFQRTGDLSEPLSVVILQAWCQRFIYVAVIAIEPSLLFDCQFIRVDRFQVDGTECKGFQLQKPAELCLHVGSNEHGVLDAHAKTMVEIKSGFVGHGHPWQQGCASPLHTYLMWPFVYRQTTAHAMSGAVHVVHSLAPHCTSRHHVYLCTGGSLRKLCHGELDMPFQHQGIYMPLLVGEGT